ncbi:MAG TPA: hypothetical protein VFH27_09380 [Longimicrobiaceae bacterium]|nr:hypothetical protein [Longimicrobiaceae bacterium]
MKKLELNVENLEVTSFTTEDCTREMPLGHGVVLTDALKDFAKTWLIACD